MDNSTPEREQDESNLQKSQRLIKEIVKHGAYIETVKVELTEFNLELDGAKVVVYDAFSYFSDETGGPVYGVTIDYMDSNDQRRRDHLSFKGYRESPYVSIDGNDSLTRIASEADAEPFCHFLHYIRSNLGEPQFAARTWRGEQESTQHYDARWGAEVYSSPPPLDPMDLLQGDF